MTHNPMTHHATEFSDPLYGDLPAQASIQAPVQGEAGQYADARLFELSAAIGPGLLNRRADVFKLQTLLHREGYLPDAGPDGGWGGDWSNRDDYALRRFQRDNGLDVDGVAAPAGETITTFRGFYMQQPPLQSMKPLSGQSGQVSGRAA